MITVIMGLLQDYSGFFGDVITSLLLDEEELQEVFGIHRTLLHDINGVGKKRAWSSVRDLPGRAEGAN
ncbi:hypothetical protein O3P69_008585 [Scylla paramamosain]|uniref:Uncharacterized protein n=1 Tax=Scylla paramamosain TaxID=85552 RepID=A0AAW0SKP1_SCYPA